ncbi:MAG: phosphotransferase, partial [Gemmatimonadota bacterium]
AAFHRDADSGPRIARFGRWDVVARNARENFTQSLPHLERTVSRDVLARTARLTEEELARRRELIEERARARRPRDTHGDLHLDHVYLLPDREPPDDLVVIDCIEFSDRFRYADPVADVAFLYMDLVFRGRRRWAERLADAYFRETGDAEGRTLLPLYAAYRAHVRGKVEGMTVDDEDVSPDERSDAARDSRAHWLVGLGQLARPSRRPALLLVGGLPGTGKSTLARGLAREANVRVVATDPTRKRLAG